MAHAFTPPPPGQLSEQIDLPDHMLSLGIIHMDGAGLRVCVWDGHTMRHMAAARARRWAHELVDGEFGAAFQPVADGLRKLCDKVEEIEARVVIMADGRLRAMPVEGHA